MSRGVAMAATVGGCPTIAASSIPAVTAATMTKVDRLAVDGYGITLLQMMEQAGSHLAEAVRLELGGDTLVDRRVVVAVGPGNNGGGGLVAARHLINRGARVRVILARPALRMTEAGRHQVATLISMGASCCVAMYDLATVDLAETLESSEIIVDAVLGYRIEAAPRGDVLTLLEAIVQARRPVVSLDLPSGMDPDTGDAAGVAVTAQATVTLDLPKAGLLSDAGAARSGRLYLADIGIPAAAHAAAGVPVDAPFGRGRLVVLERIA